MYQLLISQIFFIGLYIEKIELMITFNYWQRLQSLRNNERII